MRERERERERATCREREFNDSLHNILVFWEASVYIALLHVYQISMLTLLWKYIMYNSCISQCFLLWGVAHIGSTPPTQSLPCMGGVWVCFDFFVSESC